MVEGLQEGPTTARWLAWATAVLLALAVGSLAVLNAGGAGTGAGVVSAAGGTASTVDLTSTTTTVTSLVRPVASAPPTTVARSTTVPKAAAAVLAAIGSTTTTQRPATTSTTSPPVTSTTSTSTSTTTTTSTTVPGRAIMTVANVHPNAFQVKLNTLEFTLEPGQNREVDLVLGPNGSYVVEAQAVADLTCRHDGGGALQAGGRYRLEIVAAPGGCGNGTVPNFELPVRPI